MKYAPDLILYIGPRSTAVGGGRGVWGCEGGGGIFPSSTFMIRRAGLLMRKRILAALWIIYCPFLYIVLFVLFYTQCSLCALLYIELFMLFYTQCSFKHSVICALLYLVLFSSFIHSDLFSILDIVLFVLFQTKCSLWSFRRSDHCPLLYIVIFMLL